MVLIVLNNRGNGTRLLAYGLTIKNTNTYNTHMNSKELIRLIEAKGWRLARVSGSHHIFCRDEHEGHISIPHPRKDLGIGLTEKIKKQAGLR